MEINSLLLSCERLIYLLTQLFFFYNLRRRAEEIWHGAVTFHYNYFVKFIIFAYEMELKQSETDQEPMCNAFHEKRTNRFSYPNRASITRPIDLTFQILTDWREPPDNNLFFRLLGRLENKHWSVAEHKSCMCFYWANQARGDDGVLSSKSS